MKHASCLITLLLFGLCVPANSVPVAAFNLRKLIEDSDVVVMGSISSVTKKGPKSIQINGTPQEAIEMIGEIKVDKILKQSSQQPEQIAFTFYYPLKAIPFEGVTPNTYRILFLRHGPNGLEFTNPYYPSVVSMPGGIARGSPLDFVLERLSAVLSSTSSSTEEKSKAIVRLLDVYEPAATDALKVAARGDLDLNLKLTAVAGLLRRNETAVMDIAEDHLMHPSGGVYSWVQESLAGSLAGLRDPATIPSLSRLLHAPGVQTRRSAAYALFDMKAQTAIEPLSTALDDSDQDVRYIAVIGLADLLGVSDWRPLRDEFNENESKYVGYWKKWTNIQFPKNGSRRN